MDKLVTGQLPFTQLQMAKFAHQKVALVEFLGEVLERLEQGKLLHLRQHLDDELFSLYARGNCLPVQRIGHDPTILFIAVETAPFLERAEELDGKESIAGCALKEGGTKFLIQAVGLSVEQLVSEGASTLCLRLSEGNRESLKAVGAAYTARPRRGAVAAPAHCLPGLQSCGST